MKFIFYLCLLVLSVQAEWYQHYQEITDQSARRYAREAFAEAQKFYGKPNVKVKGVYLYQSKYAKNPYYLSSVDVIDWQGLIQSLQSNKNGLKEVFLKEFTDFQALKKEGLSFADKQNLIKHLNSLIDNEGLFKNLNDLSLEGEEKSWAGKRFSRLV